MTKSYEKGENEFTAAARREAARTGASVEEILERMLREAQQGKDKAREMKIIQAQKFCRERNRRKRRRRR